MEKKTPALAELFGRVAPTYGLINHFLTFALDLHWRRRAARLAQDINGSLWVDVCSGPGDMARCLARQSKKATKILAIDFCWPMLRQNQRKGDYLSTIYPIMANAGHLPLKDESVDLLTIAFATRNLFSSQPALLNFFQEFRRVLRPGGVFLNLETSQPRNRLFRRAFHLYVKTLVRPVGSLISRERPAYHYLSTTIPRFFAADELAKLLIAAGFSSVHYFPLTGGIAAIHLATK